MRRSLHRLMLAAIVALAAVELQAARMKISAERDKTADFSVLHTYGWLDTLPFVQKMAPDARDPRLTAEALDAPIRAAIDRSLAERRFVPARGEASPDFHVTYLAAVGLDMNVSVLGETYGYITGWGSPFLGYTPTTSLQVIEQGTLIVDVVSADRAKAIWRGQATGAIERTRSERDRLEVINDAVRRMFAKFPKR